MVLTELYEDSTRSSLRGETWCQRKVSLLQWCAISRAVSWHRSVHSGRFFQVQLPSGQRGQREPVQSRVSCSRMIGSVEVLRRRLVGRGRPWQWQTRMLVNESGGVLFLDKGDERS